jgi:hypothetical protein
MVNPASLMLGINRGGSVSLILSTTAKGAQASSVMQTGVGGLALAGLLLLAVPRRHRYARYFILLLVLTMGTVVGGLTGCGSANQTGTPLGSAMLTLTASSGSISHSQTINVQITAGN